MPTVARVVGPLARELGARWVRRGRAPRANMALKAMLIHASSAVSELAYRGTPGNTWFIDLTTCRPRLDATNVALLATLPGIGELSSHPGYADEALRATDSLIQHREDDLVLLTDGLLREALGRDCVLWRVH
jgi:predicted glycoside hydrolase/deacetylase ChbG (UPF0249 family)